jgi:hypothetical protein
MLHPGLLSRISKMYLSLTYFCSEARRVWAVVICDSYVWHPGLNYLPGSQLFWITFFAVFLSSFWPVGLLAGYLKVVKKYLLYEEYYLLEYGILQSFSRLPTFRKVARCHISDDSGVTLHRHSRQYVIAYVSFRIFLIHRHSLIPRSVTSKRENVKFSLCLIS